MRPRIIAEGDDLAGFALAGVDPLPIEDLAMIDGDDVIAVISAESASRAQQLLSNWTKSGGGPMFAGLPER